MSVLTYMFGFQRHLPLTSREAERIQFLRKPKVKNFIYNVISRHFFFLKIMLIETFSS